MSTTSSETPYAASGRRVWAEGGSAFAGIMLATLGVFQIFEAIAALANDDVYVKGVNYVFQFDLTTWGWIHLILGIVAVATGLGLMAGQTWSQILGLVIAFLTALSAFSFLPYYPGWAIVILAFDVFVIWALCTQLANE
jgi:hypothetical protein